MLVRNVVGDDVDDGPDAQVPGFRDQPFRLGERPEGRVNGSIVGDIVSTVGKRRQVPGREPDGVHAELQKIPKPRPYTGQVADAVTVAVREAPDVHLVDDRPAPPLRVGVGGPRSLLRARRTAS